MKLILVILSFLTCTVISAQSHDERLFADLNIMEKRTYKIVVDSLTHTIDTQMTIKRRYNDFGHRTSTTIFNKDTLKKKYVFTYESDTLLKEVRLWHAQDTVPVQTTSYHYENNLLKRVVTNFKPEEDFLETTVFKYKNGKKIKETTSYPWHKNQSVRKYKYDNSGRLYEVRTKGKKYVKRYHYDHEGLLVSISRANGNYDRLMEHSEFDEHGRIYKKTYSHNCNGVWGLEGWQDLICDNILVIESQYSPLGLIVKQWQYIDDQLDVEVYHQFIDQAGRLLGRLEED